MACQLYTAKAPVPTHLQQEAAVAQLACPHIHITVVDLHVENEGCTAHHLDMVLDVINDQVILRNEQDSSSSTAAMLLCQAVKPGRTCKPHIAHHTLAINSYSQSAHRTVQASKMTFSSAVLFTHDDLFDTVVVPISTALPNTPGSRSG